jgi:PAS domain S-box-containing protein
MCAVRGEDVNMSDEADLSLNVLPIPILAVDHNMNIVYVNDAFAQLVGIQKDGLEGTPILSLIVSETSGIERALTTGDTSVVETWATVKGKRYFFEYRTGLAKR